jgi:molybdate transport system substrate-binding protein
VSDSLKVHSGGAAQGLVGALAAAFEREAGLTIDGTFGAVGAMRERLLAGDPSDLVILTAALIRDLGAAGHVRAEEAADIGVVTTSVAVRAGDPEPPISDLVSLRAALLAADEVFFPDPEKATAGIHFAGVLDKLGITAELRDRLRTFPNGATAMAALARSTSARPIGSTQTTEILSTSGLTLVGPLPPGAELATTYTAAPASRAAHPDAARELIRRLTSPENAAARKTAGFLPLA